MDRAKQRGSNVFREVVSIIKECCTEKFTSLMEKNPDLFQSVDASKSTLLHYASAHGNEDMVQYLVDGGMAIDDQDAMGNTALMKALKKKQTSIVIQTLLAAGSDVALVNNEYKSALHIAFEEQYFTPQTGKLFLGELSKNSPKYIELADGLIEAGCLLHQACYFRLSILTECFLLRKIPVTTMNSVSKQTALHVASSVGDSKSVQLILKYALSSHKEIATFKDDLISNNEVNNHEDGSVLDICKYESVDVQKNTSLCNSLERGYKKLDRNSFINAQDFTKTTPLMEAVMKKNELIVQSLLSNGADITVTNTEGKNSLHLLFEERYFKPEVGIIIFEGLCKKFSTFQEIAEVLINHGCFIYQSCCFKRADVTEYMLDHGVPLEPVEPTLKLSALHVSVQFEDIHTAKLLLNRGANINALDHKNDTPLSYIYQHRKDHTSEKIELLKIFLSQREISAFSLNSAEHFQISSILLGGNGEAIRLLLQSDIDFTVKNPINGRSILHYLAANRHPGIIDELKNHIDKLDVNSGDCSGLTPLHIGVLNRNVSMIQFLLDQSARTNCTENDYGRTPLFFAFARFKLAFKKEFDQCVELLLQHNADPQLTFTDPNNKQISVFDTTKINPTNRLKAVTAYLAIQEKLGVPITEKTNAKLHSYPRLEDYFYRCQKLLNKNISGSVTLFKLLTSDKRKIARFSANKELVLKLDRLGYKKNLKSTYPCYYNSVKKRISNGIQCKRFLDQIANILCELLEDYFSQVHFFVDKIIDFLDDKSLQVLYKSSEAAREKSEDSMTVT